MNRLASLIIFTLISYMFQSCNEKNEIREIESYNGRKITTKALDEFLKNQIDSLSIPSISISIINDGDISYNNSLGVTNTTTNQAVNKKSIFEAASLSKPVFALFVMKLGEKGIIDLDRPLHYYLPDEEMEKDQRYKNVSARMVLSHRTGFPNWRWFDKPPEDLEINRGDFFMVNDPNTTFNYSGEAYQYLARVIAHLNFVNMNELNELFQNEIAKPLAMEHAYFVWNDYLYNNKVSGHIDGKPKKMKWGTALPHQNSNIFSASGGLRTEANSYAHFLTSIIHKKGLYKETYEEMLSPYTLMPRDNVNYIEDGITHWSLGFGIKPTENDTIYRHGGSNKDFQSEFAFSIKKKYGYVFFVNCNKGNELKEKLEQFLGMGTNQN